MKEKVTYIDVEPKWIDLGNLMIDPKFKGQLDPALKIADIVRQAQKKGLKSVTFKFPNTSGKMIIEEGEKK